MVARGPPAYGTMIRLETAAWDSENAYSENTIRGQYEHLNRPRLVNAGYRPKRADTCRIFG